MCDTASLSRLRDQLLKASSTSEKISHLDAFPGVREFIQKLGFLQTFLMGLTPECESAFKQLIAIGQAPFLFGSAEDGFLSGELLRDLLMKLLSIDRFYRELGGIVGYQLRVLELLEGSCEEGRSSQSTYHSPRFEDLGTETDAVLQAISWGIDALPETAEMYPLGGAADRLHLVDPKTGLELPAAKLPFAGRTLLEHLIRDLQAREYLYFQIHGKQLTTPIAIMTSAEKNNHAHVTEICREANWFGRPQESFRFFTQPLVPTVNRKGEWCTVGPLKPLLKPGGHGVIWKLARDEGVFDWLARQGRTKTIVRQINNPLAGLDYGLLAFSGLGCRKKMLFGFASCPRLLKAAEGVNVLIERKLEGKTEFVLTNIEYCDFAKFGIEDRPLKEGEPYSRFSSNTNILFADLNALSNAVERCPFPGLLINLKKGTYFTDSGEKREDCIGRLESTMQNIADVFIEEKPFGSPPVTERTFVTYNQRHKTISTAKKGYVSSHSIQETPENCFYDLMTAHRELLERFCGFTLPPRKEIEIYLQEGPECLFLYHPALGPLYSIIRKKLRGGRFYPGAELLLEIANADLSNLSLRGSLQIKADQLMGHRNAEGMLCYSDRVGRCILEDVSVDNMGVDWASSSPFWKMDLKRREFVEIHLKGNSLFVAKNVHFQGSHLFVVEDGMKMEVSQKDGKLTISTKRESP